MFSWDTAKAVRNFAKHGVAFEDAAGIFADSEALNWSDAGHSQSEPRSKRLGRCFGGRVLLVVYTIRRARDGKETVRIISAGQASRKERTAYAGQPD